MTVRYVFLGDKMTDPLLIGMPCDPVTRDDGRCIISTRMATALVLFENGIHCVVPRRRLRLVAKMPHVEDRYGHWFVISRTSYGWHRIDVPAPVAPPASDPHPLTNPRKRAKKV